MRNRTWMAGTLLSFMLAGPAWAQRPASSLLTGVGPQDIVFKPVDTSQAVAPIPLTTDKFSIARLFSRAFIPDFLKSASTTPPPLRPTVTSIKTGSPLHPVPAITSLPVNPYPSPIQPLPPTTVLPPIPISPFQPLPPTTVLPPIPISPFQPLPPIIPNP